MVSRGTYTHLLGKSAVFAAVALLLFSNLALAEYSAADGSHDTLYTLEVDSKRPTTEKDRDIDVLTGMDVAGDVEVGSLTIGGETFQHLSNLGAFTQSGTIASFVDGNVGIGTTTPDRPLHVAGFTLTETLEVGSTFNGADAAWVDITVDTLDTPGEPAIRLAKSGPSGGEYVFRLKDNNLETFDRVNQQVRMTLDDQGNVGIGTTTPATKLEVAGTITASDFVLGGTSLISQIAGAGTWEEDSDNVFRDIGRVGIGTDTPLSLLHISGPRNIPGLLIQGANANEGDIATVDGQAFQMGHWDPVNNAFTERFRITGAGDIKATGKVISDVGFCIGSGSDCITTIPKETLMFEIDWTPWNKGTGQIFTHTLNQPPTDCWSEIWIAGNNDGTQAAFLGTDGTYTFPQRANNQEVTTTNAYAGPRIIKEDNNQFTLFHGTEILAFDELAAGNKVGHHINKNAADSSIWTATNNFDPHIKVKYYCQPGSTSAGTSPKLLVSGDIRIAPSTGGTLIFPDGSALSTAANAATSIDTVSSNTDAVIQADVDTDGTGNILLKTGGTTRATVTTDGALRADKLQLSDTGGNEIYWDLQEEANNDLTFKYMNEKVRITAMGNVGIGITPTEKLEVAGKIKGTELCIGTDCRDAWPAASTASATTSSSGSPIELETSSYAEVTPSGVGSSYVCPDNKKVLSCRTYASPSGTAVCSTAQSSDGTTCSFGGCIGIDFRTEIICGKVTGTATTSSSGVAGISSLNGNIGIGTASPISTLEIAGQQGSTGSRNLRVTYPPGANLAGTEFAALAHNPASGGNKWTAIYGKAGAATYAGYFDGRVDIAGTAGSSGTRNLRVTFPGGGSLTGTEFAALANNPSSTGNGWSAVYANAGAAEYAGYFVGNLFSSQRSGASIDIAEWIPFKGEKPKAGEVVVYHSESTVKKSENAYDTTALGIVSTKPHLSMGEEYKSNNSVQLALSGRVPLKVTDENGPIKGGDLLTTSSTPGHAMKCKDNTKCMGAIIGKALETHDKGQGTIVALVTLQ